jgi:hypothetical protein
MATEDWIQESLARLESLEEERKKHEDALETATDPATPRMHTQAIERLEVKIRALYAELEAVANESQTGAGEDDGDDDGDGEEEGAGDPTHVFRPEDLARAAAPVAAAAPAPVTAAPTPVASRPAPAPAPMASPFGGAPQPSVSPFGEAPVAAPFGSPAMESQPFSSSSAPSFDSGDVDSDGGGGGGAKIAIIVVLLAALGGAAYFFLGTKKEEPPPPTTAPTELKVIKSGEVPPDTQGPRTPKGTDINSTQGSQIKEDNRPRNTGGGGGGGSSTPSTTDKPKKKDPNAKIEHTDDPLAGIR